VAFFGSIPAGVALVYAARGATARAAAAVYALSLVALYGVSSLYHRLNWTPRVRRLMRRTDHAMIYVLIAGSYTPFSVLGMRGTLRWVVLGAVWAVAVVGAALKFGWFDHVHRLGGPLYIALGWFAVVGAPQFVRNLSGPVLALVVVGGVLYTVGAIVLLRRKPDPFPAVFGYHEVWHSFVVCASVCHYVAAMMLVTA
jgi:hemolysin III